MYQEFLVIFIIKHIYYKWLSNANKKYHDEMISSSLFTISSTFELKQSTKKLYALIQAL